MSSNAPCEQSSHTAHIVEVHPTLQVADEDNDPTMDHDPVTPAGGLLVTTVPAVTLVMMIQTIRSTMTK